MSKLADWVRSLIEHLAERDFVVENVDLKKEIKRLRRRVEDQEKEIQHLIADPTHQSLRKRIEELEKTARMQSEWIHENCGANLEGMWVTYKDINAAVDLCFENPTEDGWHYLRPLGIERCEGCACGYVPSSAGDGDPIPAQKCPVCAKFTGHGWVIGGVE
jgi:hypothetical protein